MIPSTTVREVLQSAPSACQAAKLVGISRTTLRRLAYSNQLGELFEECTRRGSAIVPAQSALIEMAGRTLAGVEVIERRRAAGLQNACWLCRFPACGHEAVYEGIYLRKQEKSQQIIRCKVCEPRRSKGVRRMQTIMVNATERVVADHQELTYEDIVRLSGKPARADYTVTARSLSPEGISLARTLVAGQSLGRADACRGWVFNVVMTGGA